MKRCITIIINLIILLSITTNPISAKKLKIVTTYPFLADLVKNIVKEKADVKSLASGYEDPHFVDPRPSMVARIRNADAVVLVGMSCDIWIDGIIDAARNSDIVFGAPGYIDVSIKIEKLEVPTGKVDASMGHVHPDGNPHFYTDPNNVITMLEIIVEKLSHISPGNTEFFNKNREEYNTKLNEKIVEWKKLLAPVINVKIVTYHSSWPYFEKFSGLKIVGHLEPKPGIPPSPSHLQKLITMIKNQNIKLILAENYFSKKASEFLKDKTGIKILYLPVDLQKDEGITSYIDLWDKNIKALITILQ